MEQKLNATVISLQRRAKTALESIDGKTTATDTDSISGASASVATVITTGDIGAVNDTWKIQGLEIDCQGYKTIGIWVDFTVNDSTGNQIQVLSRHTTAGDNHVMESVSDYQKTIGDSDIKIYYEFEVDNALPFIAIQTKATLIGATEGTVTIKVTKGY